MLLNAGKTLKPHSCVTRNVMAPGGDSNIKRLGGQKIREPRPDWSPLGVNFKVLDEHPHPFLYSGPPPGSWVSGTVVV